MITIYGAKGAARCLVKLVSNSFLFACALSAAHCLAPEDSVAQKSLRLQVPLDKSKVASDSFLIARVISVDDLTLQSAFLMDYSRKVGLKVGSENSFVAVTAGSLSKGNLLSGLLRVRSKTRKLPPLKLKKRRSKKVAARTPVMHPFVPSPTILESASETEMAVVAFRDAAFSVSGPGTVPWMALAGRDTAATAMASVECYLKEDGFVIAETSSEFVRAREVELELCRSGNSSACFDPENYLTPNAAVTGSFTSDGANFTVALTFLDEQGAVAATTSVQGPFESFIDLLLTAGKDLGEKVCRSRELKVTIAPSGFSQNNCAYTDAGGCGGCSEFRNGYYWEGGHYLGDMRGPIGTILKISSSDGETSRGTVACGDWSPIACEQNLCCKREAGQPASGRYDAQLNFPLNAQHCECQIVIPSLNLTAKVEKGTRSKSESLAISCPG